MNDVSSRINPGVFGPLSICLVLAGWVMAAIAISALPAQVPLHFGADGTVTGTGSSSGLWSVPALATATYVFMTALQFVPQEKLNVPVTITDQNREPVYSLARGLMRAARVGVLFTFLGVEWAEIHVAGTGAIDTAAVLAVALPVVAMLGWLTSFFVRMARA